MTREVDWGDIKASTPKRDMAKNLVREVDWGEETKEKPMGSSIQDYLTKTFVDPIRAAKGKTGLETAGNLMDLFVNRPVEMTGLPSAARGFFQGGENLIRGVGNIPADVFKMSPRNFPGTNHQAYPIPETEFPRPHNVNPYIDQAAETIGELGGTMPIAKGYQGIKSALEHIPYAKIPEIIKSLIAGSATGATLAPDNRKLGAGLGLGAEVGSAAIRGGKNFISNRNTSAMGRDYLQAQLNLERQKSAENELKAISKHQFGLNTPTSMELSTREKGKELAQHDATQSAYNRNTPMLPGEQLVSEAHHGLNNIDNVLRQTLGEGQQHSLDLSERISNAIEGVPTAEPHPVTGFPREVRKGGLREQIGSQYDKLADTFPEKIQLPAKVDVKGIQKEYEQLLKDFPGLPEATKEEFKRIAEKSHPGIPGQEINPRAFFKAYRSMKQQEGALRSKAHTFGTSLADAQTLNDKANKLKETHEDMLKIVESHFPKNTIKELHRINHEYSTQVAPLNKNKIYINMLESGLVPGNILEKIAGKQKGNSILRNMLLKDPELSRLALGHSYAEKPENLLKPNDAIKPYIQANPEIANLVGLQRQAQNNLTTATHNELAVGQFKNLPKLRAQYNRQRVMTQHLRNEAEATGISKEEVLKRKAKYEDAQRKLNNFIKKSLGTGILAGIGTYAANKLLQ